MITRRITRRSALRQTVEAFCDITIQSVRRLNHRLAKGEIPNKRLTGVEAKRHYRLVRYLLIQRRREQGCSLAQIGTELNVSRQRIKQILHMYKDNE